MENKLTNTEAKQEAIKKAVKILSVISNSNPLQRKISIKGKLALIRSDQYMILCKHYPTSLNPHNNSRLMNYCIKHSKKEQYI